MTAVTDGTTRLDILSGRRLGVPHLPLWQSPAGPRASTRVGHPMMVPVAAVAVCLPEAQSPAAHSGSKAGPENPDEPKGTVRNVASLLWPLGRCIASRPWQSMFRVLRLLFLTQCTAAFFWPFFRSSAWCIATQAAPIARARLYPGGGGCV